jgi:Ni/Co efflux regulator RcnB
MYMKVLATSAATLALIAGLAVAPLAIAAHHGGPAPGFSPQDHPNHHWRNGEHMSHGDWNNSQPVDWRQHHLHAPPRGYEWRQSNGNFVLAAVATGLITSIIAANGH